jgi:probable O-glycosylation ligase (exosortase A-associated)
MRDILLALVIAALLPMAFKRPWVGALMFAWISVMNPHKLAWGFAHNFPWAQVIAIVTLTGFLLHRSERKVFPWSGATVVYLLLMVWMAVTSMFAMADMTWVQGRLIFVMKIHLMILVTLMLLRERKQIELLVWVLVGSIGFFGVKGGAFTIATGGAGRVWGPPGGMIEENNALAVALVMMMPLMFYLYYTNKRRWARYALGFCMAMMAFAILGTQSRGALLALFAMASLLGLKSNHPVRASIVIAVFVAMVVAFMPDSWSARMETIRSYQADTSAMSRIYTWLTIWNLAMDRPFLGAGFGTDTLTVFGLYAPTEPPYDIFTGTVFVAHSIYLQALGEHGFPGLILYLLLAFLTWRMASRTSKLTKKDPEFAEWVPLLMRMSQVSLVGFAVGGAFLTLMHLDVTYYIMVLVLLTHATVRETLAARALAAQPRPGAMPQAPSTPAAPVPGRPWPGIRT